MIAWFGAGWFDQVMPLRNKKSLKCVILIRNQIATITETNLCMLYSAGKAPINAVRNNPIDRVGPGRLLPGYFEITHYK